MDRKWLFYSSFLATTYEGVHRLDTLGILNSPKRDSKVARLLRIFYQNLDCMSNKNRKGGRVLTLLTSTWGIMAISGFVGVVMGHGIGYDSCFRDKIEVQRATEYLIVQRQEFLEMARQEVKTGDPFTHKMSNEYYDTARKFSVKVGTHDDC